MSNELVVFPVTDLAIAELGKKLSGLVVPFGDKPAYKALSSSITELVTVRTNIEKVRVSEKAGLLERGRALDAEAKRLTALVLEHETPLRAKKEAIDAEDARIKAEKAEAERQRIAAIRERMNRIINSPLKANGKTSAEIELIVSALDKYSVDESFSEFMAETKMLKATALLELNSLLEARKAYEVAEAERVKKEFETAEANRIESERLALEAEKLKQERARFEAEAAEARRIEAKRLADEAEKLKKERALFEAEQSAIAEKQRLECEEYEAKVAAENAVREAELARIQAYEDAEKQAAVIAIAVDNLDEIDPVAADNSPEIIDDISLLQDREKDLKLLVQWIQSFKDSKPTFTTENAEIIAQSIIANFPPIEV